MRPLLRSILVLAITTSPPAPAQAQDPPNGEWAKMKGELQRFSQDTLPKWGIEVTVDKPEMEDETKGGIGALPSHFKVTGGYEDPDTVRMSVETNVGREKGVSVGFQGSFKSEADAKSVDGEGSISLPGGSTVKFKYSHEKGFEADLKASQQYTFASVGFGEHGDPFKVGIKAGPVTVKVDPVVYVKHFRQFAPKAVEAIEKKVGGVFISFDLGMMAMAMTAAPPERVKSLSELTFVSLKRLLARKEAKGAPDLGPLTSVQGIVVDPKEADVILVGRNEAWAPRIPTDLLVALLRSVWRDGLAPAISIDRGLDVHADHHPRVDGVSPGLEDSSLVRIMLDADYTMKRQTLGGPPPLVPHFLSLQDRAEQWTRQEYPMSHSRLWFHPQPLAAGDVWKLDSPEGGLLLFETGVQLSTEGEGITSATPGTLLRGSPLLEGWALDMTARFGDFERSIPVYKQLRQIFELSLACSLLRLSWEAKTPSGLLRRLSETPLAQDPHPWSFPVAQLEYKTTAGWTLKVVGGVETRRRTDRQRLVVVKELQSLLSKLKEAAWEGWTLRMDGAFQPIVRESEFAYRSALADAYLTDAEVEHRSGRQDRALSKASQSIEVDPDFGEARSFRAEMLLVLGRPEEALQDAERAVQIIPEDYWTLLLRALAKVELKKFQEALADTSVVLRNRPDWAYAYLVDGLAKAGAGDSDGAIAAHTRAISMAPQHAFLYFHRANAKVAKADLKGAIEDFSKAIDMDSQSAVLYQARGNAEILSRAFDTATRDFTKALEMDPKNVLAILGRGTSRTATNDFEGAVQDFSRLIALAPTNAGAYLARGAALLELKNVAGAIGDFDKAVELDPHSPKVYRQRAEARLAQGDSAGAGKDFTRAFEEDAAYGKGDPGPAVAALIEMLEKKLYPGATAGFERVYRDFPDRKELRSIVAYNAACGHALLGQPKESLDWLERAVEAGFNDVEQLEKDEDLEILRKEGRYRKLLERLKGEK